MSHELMNTSQKQNRKSNPMKWRTLSQYTVLSLHFLKHTLTVMHASTKSGPLVFHYLLMVSDNLRNQRAISGAEWSSNHLPASQSLPLLITLPPDSYHFSPLYSSLLSWEQEARARQVGGCVYVSEREKDHEASLYLGNARSCLSDTGQSKGALYRLRTKLHPIEGVKKVFRGEETHFKCCNFVKNLFSLFECWDQNSQTESGFHIPNV